jgi:alpha-beta hydrolase superfamily lysophospholipase
MRHEPGRRLPRRLIRSLAILALGIALGFYVTAVLSVRGMFFHRVEKNLHTPEELGLAAETVALTSADGIPLEAWWIPAERPGGIVVLLHGMDGLDASCLLSHARFLHDAGYAVVALDMRAHGRSGGNRIALAFDEPKDVAAVLDWIAGRGDLRGVPVALWGFSMGGATAIRAAAAREEVAAVVSVSAFASVDRMIGAGLELVGTPRPLIAVYIPFVKLALATVYGTWPATASPLHDIARIAPRPVLIVHGTADRQVPVSQAGLLLEASGGRAETWIVEGADHLVFRGDGSGPEDDAYRARILDFLARALRPRTEPAP